MQRRLLNLAVLLSFATGLKADAQLMQLERDDLPAPPNQRHEVQATVTPCISWIDDTVPIKGFLLCVHGLGLHKGTYEAFGKRMAKLGWGVYAVDVRGFGSFQTMPGEAPRRVDFAGCLQDVKAALEFIHHEHPESAIFIVGESMGGGVSLQAASRFPELIDGLISCVPGAQRFHSGKDSVNVGLKMLAGPTKTFDVTKIVVDRSTQKTELRDAWLKDSLGRFQLSPMELLQFQMFMDENDKAARKIVKTPVLMMSGTEDQLVRHEDQIDLIKDIGSTDKHQVFVVGAEHLILEEGQFDDSVVALIDQWLTAHAPTVELSTGAQLKTPDSDKAKQ